MTAADRHRQQAEQVAREIAAPWPPAQQAVERVAAALAAAERAVHDRYQALAAELARMQGDEAPLTARAYWDAAARIRSLTDTEGEPDADDA